MNATQPALPLTGGCSCGAIRYEIGAFPLLLYTCNCTDCQTASGSAFALNMPVATNCFRILRGEPKGWHHKSPSGADVTSWFCADCGARIYGERTGRPDSINLRAGTLDDTSWLVPAAHMFMRSAQPWVLPAAIAECHEIVPDDFRPLAAKWRAMWPEFFPQ
ncbi:GFA family protein [Bradyrhizobium sp.]|uniref:GFA family protein n=1 Tax=Bradyrhizobium sp. TaxID=376 RepID=UPI003C77C1B0